LSYGHRAVGRIAPRRVLLDAMGGRGRPALGRVGSRYDASASGGTISR
jgi:hypothetical protein